MSAYPELRPCARCPRITRPKSRPASDYPFETASRGDSQYCQSCRLAIKGITKQPRRPAKAGAEVRQIIGKPAPSTIAGLTSFIEARRRRLNHGQVIRR